MRVATRPFAIAALLAVHACAARPPEATRASPKMQEHVMAMIQVVEPALDPNCGERELMKTEIIKRATAADYTAVERWTIDRCGKPVSYLVSFMPGATGGVNFSVKLEK